MSALLMHATTVYISSAEEALCQSHTRSVHPDLIHPKMDMVKQAMSAVAPSTQVTEPSHEEWLRADQVEVIKPDEESKA